jgi:serine/threonine protein kinase
MMESANISQEDYESIMKEVHIHTMVKSPYCVKLHQTMKTSSNIYMIMDYCNGSDLQKLMHIRKRLSQLEASMIIR